VTIATGLRGRPNPDSQANGAMMRISPLWGFDAERGQYSTLIDNNSLKVRKSQHVRW